MTAGVFSPDPHDGSVPKMTRRFAFLLLALLLPLAAAASQPPAAKPAPLVAGTDYIEIPGGTPYQPLDGKVEVVEIFAYWCHHCADFQPKVEAWKRTLPANVRFTYVPAAFDSADPFARAYFAADMAGALGKTHHALFSAIHEEESLPKNASIDQIAAFYGRLGLDTAKMKASMQGFVVGGKLVKARDFAIRSGLEGTPTLIVNGKYRIKGRNYDEQLRIADQLIAMLRSKR
jgi:thiol:disulfide interchange protein DsbA